MRLGIKHKENIFFMVLKKKRKRRILDFRAVHLSGETALKEQYWIRELFTVQAKQL